MKLKNKIELNELVEMMMNERNHNPHDYCFRLISSKYPKETHNVFNFPGEYANSLKLDVFTENGRNLKMDCAQLVMPKGDITCKSTINVEHQSYPLLDDKIAVLYDYKLFLIHQTNIPSNSVVITNIDPGKQILCFETHDQIYKIRFIVVTEEDISKRLTMLENIIKIKRQLSIEEALNFVYDAIFVDDEIAAEILEKLADLFSKSKMETNIQLDIHQVLKK
ncbi:hypothetical protein [Methanobrevibacter sp.]|uniref:hypothetical protein n=1 Tax=Methanobrevibacter sp. TaxID=66852 RepID=UPI003890F58E